MAAAEGRQAWATGGGRCGVALDALLGAAQRGGGWRWSRVLWHRPISARHGPEGSGRSSASQSAAPAARDVPNAMRSRLRPSQAYGAAIFPPHVSVGARMRCSRSAAGARPRRRHTRRSSPPLRCRVCSWRVAAPGCTRSARCRCLPPPPRAPPPSPRPARRTRCRQADPATICAAPAVAVAAAAVAWRRVCPRRARAPRSSARPVSSSTSATRRRRTQGWRTRCARATGRSPPPLATPAAPDSPPGAHVRRFSSQRAGLAPRAHCAVAAHDGRRRTGRRHGGTRLPLHLPHAPTHPLHPPAPPCALPPCKVDAPHSLVDDDWLDPSESRDSDAGASTISTLLSPPPAQWPLDRQQARPPLDLRSMSTAPQLDPASFSPRPQAPKLKRWLAGGGHGGGRLLRSLGGQAPRGFALILL